MAQIDAAFWDERYAERGKAFGLAPNDFLVSQRDRILQACEECGSHRVLSLGDGEGRNGIWLAQLGLDVTAVDLSAVALRHAAERARSLGLPLQTVQADLMEFDMGTQQWGAAVSIFCHLPSAVRQRVYRNIVEALAPHGIFVLESYTPQQIGRGTGGPSDPDMLSTEQSLRQELAGLRFELVQELTREIHEGTRHGGPSDVVQAVAVKP